MFDKDRYILAYRKLKSVPGNMTPGATGETLDGYSLATIDKTIQKLKTREFQFEPSRRIHIPKKNNSTRPLGIPNPRDKIVQTVLLDLLEKEYEAKVFNNASHGFRPNRSCHSALLEIKR